MKVAIYARVSTEEQTELNQVNILKQWSKRRDYQVYEEYIKSGDAEELVDIANFAMMLWHRINKTQQYQ